MTADGDAVGGGCDSLAPRPAPSARQPTAGPLTRDEARALVAACGKGFRGHRDRATVVLLWRCGLRASEVAQQRVADLRFEGGTGVLRVSAPKGFGRGALQRELGLDRKVADLLKRWLAVRTGAEALEQSSLVIPSRTGAGLYYQRTPGGRVEATGHFRRLLRTLAKRAGITRRVHPHCLRATFARNLYDEGVGVREIQLALGHASLTTTAVYLVSIGATEVIATTKGREW